MVDSGISATDIASVVGIFQSKVKDLIPITLIALPEMDEECEPLKKPAWQSDKFTAPEAKILIVDDSEINLMITENLLESLQMKIDTAESAAALRSTELAEYYKSVPIIALTGDASEETKEKFKLAGIDDYTEKLVMVD